jgi:hypothetical protein
LQHNSQELVATNVEEIVRMQKLWKCTERPQLFWNLIFFFNKKRFPHGWWVLIAWWMHCFMRRAFHKNNRSFHLIYNQFLSHHSIFTMD